jgi:hypothetical protein
MVVFPVRNEGMMLYRILSALYASVVILMSSAANAGPTVALSSPNDLSHLSVGQTVEIDVTLSGLPANDFIFNLNTRVLFPSSLLQAIPDPTSTSGLTAVVAPGSVFDNNVQGPLQIANFNYQGVKPDGLPDSSLTSGAATGIFSQFPNTNSGAIGLNGLYYSFLVKAISPGSGNIAFDSTAGANEYAANDTGFNYAPLPTVGPLPFTISSVPEPSSIILLAAGVAALGYWTGIRRRSVA